MAQQTIITFTDDLDGSEAVGTVTFALDGVNYEIDLSEANRERLAGVLDEFVKAGRRAGRQGKVASGRQRTPRAAEKADNTAIREWARANGYATSDRGRISREVLAAYHAAGN